MWVRNTSPYDTDEARRLVRFACRDIDMRKVCVNVRGSSNNAAAGRAYGYVPAMSNAPKTARYLITLRIGERSSFPRWHRGYKRPAYDGGAGLPPVDLRDDRWPVIVINDWREALVYIAAHEAKHIEQFREGLPISELRCEWFGAKMLKRFRAEESARRVLTSGSTDQEEEAA